MIKNKKTFFKREFSWVITVLLLFIIGIMICFGYRYYCHIMEQKNEKAIEDYTVNDFQLKVNEQDKELKELQDWLDTPHISDASRGLLYERMSLIYQDKGDNGGDHPIDDPTLLAPYGINNLEEEFVKEKLNGSKMILRSKTLRLKFKRF